MVSRKSMPDAEGIQRQQTVRLREVRNESLEEGARIARTRGDEWAARTYDTMRRSWDLIDKAYDVIQEEHADLAKAFRRRRKASVAIIVAAAVLLVTQVPWWLFG